jgi:hypothetical protein
MLSGIAGMIIFALRMVEQTAFWGDKIMWIFRFICPTFQICNAIIFASNNKLLTKQRHTIREDIRRKAGSAKVNLPSTIQPRFPMEMANIGGDLYTLVFHAVFWWLVFIIIERTPKGYFEKLFQSKKDLEKQKNL